MLTTDATSLPRLMQCTGYTFVKRGPQQPDDDTTLRDEGNAVHWLAQGMFEGRIDPEQATNTEAYNGVFLTPAMVEHAVAYVERCRLHGWGAMEHETSHGSQGLFAIRGRADFVGFTNGVVTITDLKYGYRTVEPTDNWTLISHAIAATEWFARAGHTVTAVTLTIEQPRAYHPLGPIRSWSFSYEHLCVLTRRLYDRLSNPSEALETGPQCYKCPAAAHCPALREASMNAIDTVLDTSYSDAFDGVTLAQQLTILRRADKVVKERLGALEDLAMHRLQHGEIINGYAIDRPKGNTRLKPNITPDTVLALTGKNVGKVVMPSVAELKAAGVGQAVVDAITERAEGKPKLVAVDADSLARKLLGVS